MHSEIAYTLTTEGWREHMKKQLMEQQSLALNTLTLPHELRSKGESDDFLRGYFHAMTFAITHWDQLLKEKESSHQRATAEAQEAPASGTPYGIDNSTLESHANGMSPTIGLPDRY